MKISANRTAMLTERTELEMQVESLKSKMEMPLLGRLVKNLVQQKIKTRKCMIEKINASLEQVN